MAAATTTPLTYKITASLPTPTEYMHLRTVAGLTAPPAGASTPQALNASVHCLVARLAEPEPEPDAATDEAGLVGKAIGMIRLVGDGALVCQVCDMAVDPGYQGRGIGKTLLDAMIAWIDEHAPHAYVSLIADPPGQALYRSRGFVDTQGIGMKRSAWGR